MSGVKVLLEVFRSEADPFAKHTSAVDSLVEAERQASDILSDIGGIGIEVDDDVAPVPMFFDPDDGLKASALESFSSAVSPGTEKESQQAVSQVVSADVSRSKLDELRDNANVRVWPNSELALVDGQQKVFDEASSVSGTDCRPFRSGVSIDVIRQLLGVQSIWGSGFRGQNVVVGIIDEGVNGTVYPVIGGFARPSAGRQPGTAPITSHGSMCAADVLVAAPAARIYDYPFLGVPRSGGALQMFQAILNQWRRDGTPQITNNSYGFVGVPNKAEWPDHEVHNINHPIHRKVREAVAAGITCFFAAGNCGGPCPSGACHPSGIGSGRSIHASNSLEEVITVAAINSVHERIGYSSEGPGMFATQKPDLATYSHFFGNFGPNRPGGLAQPFDNGTSAATPVAAGVGALLLSAFPGLHPDMIKRVLMGTATDLGPTIGWDPKVGYGAINAAAAYQLLKAT